MTENFEFGDVKLVRKSLLIFSLTALFITSIREYTTGQIEFLGFSIPVNDLNIVLLFLVGIIAFFLIAFWIRINSERYESLKNIYRLGEIEEESTIVKNFLEVFQSANSIYEDVKEKLSREQIRNFEFLKEKGESALKKNLELKQSLEKFNNRKYTDYLDILFPKIFGVATIIIVIFNLFFL